MDNINIFDDDEDDLKIGSLYEDEFSFNRAISLREMQDFEPLP